MVVVSHNRNASLIASGRDALARIKLHAAHRLDYRLLFETLDAHVTGRNENIDISKMPEGC